MKKVVVVGGGFSGCGAAIGAKLRGVEVVLIERTDSLLGVGRHGGCHAYNGRYTIMLEAKAMGCTEIFDAVESAKKYRVDLPHQKYGYLYENFRAESAIRLKMEEMGIDILFERTAEDVVMKGDTIAAVRLNNGETLEADAFVDATGGAGPEKNCIKYGRGCVLCTLKCPQYGPRVSLTNLTGVKEEMAKRGDGQFGGMSNACTVARESVDPEIIKQIEDNNGFIIIKAPKDIVDDELSYEHLRKIRTQQHISVEEYEDNIICVDVGTIKFLSRPYLRTEALHRIPGFESALFIEPLAGGRGQSIRFLSLAPWEFNLQVAARPNLFCAGEKLGLVGIMDAKVTGILAGNNAARVASGDPTLVMPKETALGEGLIWVKEECKKHENLFKKFSFLGTGGLWDHIKSKGLFTLDEEEVNNRIKEAGLYHAFIS